MVMVTRGVELRREEMNGLARFLYGVTHRDISMRSQPATKKNCNFPISRRI